MLLFWCGIRVVALCCRGGGGLSFGLFRRSCFFPGHDLLLFYWANVCVWYVLFCYAQVRFVGVVCSCGRFM